MDIKTLREKSADELKAHLIDLRKEQFSVRMQQVTGQLPKTTTFAGSVARLLASRPCSAARSKDGRYERQY